MTHRTQESSLLLMTIFIIEDANKQPDEEIHWARSRRVPMQELLVPGSQGAPPSRYLSMFTNQGHF